MERRLYSPRYANRGWNHFWQKENRQLSSKGSQSALQIVRSPWAVSSASGQAFLVYIKDDLLMASSDAAELQRAAARVQQSFASQPSGGQPSASHFAETPLYQQIVRSYQEGAGWLLCADMEQIVAGNVQSGSNHDLPPGIGDVRYLTIEHREVGGKTDNRADLTFASERQGVASWLAAPASMGSLEFVSPEASMVTSAVIRNPRSIMEGLFQMMGSGDANFSQHLSEFETKTGVNVLDDLAAPLGGEVTMAFDGPMLPTPRWKLIFEVYDPATLQATIAKLVDSYNREGSAEGRSMQLTKRQVGSQTYFVITNSNSQHMNSEVDYTFVDSYLIAAPDLGTLSQAIQNRQAGYTSDAFGGISSAPAQRRIHELLRDLLSQHRASGWPYRGATEIQRSADVTAAAIDRCAHRELRAGPDLCLWRARPHRGCEQHRLHGIRSRDSDDDGR